MINNKPMRFWLAAFAVSSLAACNSNDHDVAAVVTPPTTQTQPDAFTTQVQTDVKVSSDDIEAKDVDTIVLASSDDTEPVEVN